MSPYASGKRWALYGANCADVAPTIRGIDAVIGDPPYGMDWDTDSRRFSGGVVGNNCGRGAGRDHIRVAGDDSPFDPAPWLDYPAVVLWGYPFFAQRLPLGTTLVWVKRSPELYGTFLSDADLAWMKGGYGVYCFEKQFPPPVRAVEGGGDPGFPVTLHPNQKPIGLLSWCMERAKVPPDGLVFDGWAGSGSCGVAALRTGRRYVGCEIEPAYLPIAARRLAQAEADGVPQPLFPVTR